MPIYGIENADALDKFFTKHRKCYVYSVKVDPPPDATDSSGGLIRGKINGAWICKDCSQKIELVHTQAKPLTYEENPWKINTVK